MGVVFNIFSGVLRIKRSSESEELSHTYLKVRTQRSMDLVEEALRNKPLFNSRGSKFPHEVPQLLHIPHIKLPPLQPASQMFGPWYDECDQLMQSAALHDKRSQQFENWYLSHCLGNKPTGMSMGMLSPSRRE